MFMNWLDFVDWQPGYNTLKILGLFLITGLLLGYLIGTRKRILLKK